MLDVPTCDQQGGAGASWEQKISRLGGQAPPYPASSLPLEPYLLMSELVRKYLL